VPAATNSVIAIAVTADYFPSHVRPRQTPERLPLSSAEPKGVMEHRAYVSDAHGGTRPRDRHAPACAHALGGLIPWWARDQKLQFSTFNAKAATVSTAPAFRDVWKDGRRCLIVTDGFYEWRKPDKQPFAIACVDGALTVMAGLWDRWKSPQGERINSCTVITIQPNELLAPIHNRMPVILAPEDWPKWLGELPADDNELKALLKPYPSTGMHLWPVGKRVGNVRNNDASLAEPIAFDG